MNDNLEDIGVLKAYELDLAFGSGENDFECKVSINNHCCRERFFLYIEGTEYGGTIDDIKVDTSVGEITYIGRTWHGMLNSKVIEPEGDYLILTGEANEMLAFLLERMGLTAIFKASGEDSGISISKYQMNRYIGGYDGIMKMLKSAGAKLNIVFKNGFVELSAKPIIDYSKDEQFDTDSIDFSIRKKYRPINHLICLGSGELSARQVIHLYADHAGNISNTQTMTGLDEVTDTYDYSSVESEEELRQGGIDKLKEAWNSDEIKLSFNSNDASYDIGDIVGAVEINTGIEVAADITKKIISIKKNTTTISYKVGE